MAACLLLASSQIGRGDEHPLTAETVAARMIEQNERVSNAEGIFQKITRQYVGLDAIPKIEKDFADMLDAADTERNKAAIRSIRDRMIQQVKDSSGVITAQERYNGVLDVQRRFNITISRQSANEGVVESRSVSNGHRGVRHESMTHTAILGDPSKTSTAIGGDASNLFIVQQWMMRPNQIATTEKVTVAEREQYDGSPAIVLQQEPTDYSLNQYILKYTVLPEKGFIATRTEFVDVASRDIVRTVENTDIAEISPGVWRPGRMIDTRYRPGGKKIDTQTEVVVERINAINQQIADRRFEPDIPDDTKNIVDESRNLEMEYESPVHSGGIDSIMDALNHEAENPAFQSSRELPENTSPGSTSEPPSNVSIDGKDHAGRFSLMLWGGGIVAGIIIVGIVCTSRRRIPLRSLQ